MCLEDIGNDLQRSEVEVRYPGKLERCGSRDYLKKNEVSFLLKIPDVLHQRDSLYEPKGKGQEKPSMGSNHNTNGIEDWAEMNSLGRK